jgi:thiamine biosynthesis protein ThiI
MSVTIDKGREKLILIRLSPELTTKARGTRKRFTRKLLENIREALRETGEPFHAESQWTRVYVRTSAGDAVERLGRIPGLSSMSVVEGSCAADMDEIVRVGLDIFGERVKGKTYAVRAKRSGSHPFSSHDVQHRLGAALNPGAKVNLANPDVEVSVEIRDRSVHFFSGRQVALGGLPLGVEGKAVCLLSGGFDSAVASWLMLKRGLQLDYVFCNLAGQAYERSVVQVAKVLADKWSYGTKPRLHVIDFGPVLDNLRAHSQPKYWQLVLKRLMYRAAERVAREVGADAIVTGEAMGQVSSQTLANLAAIDPAVDLVVFRPLLGFDKTEIIDRSRRIGTFEISALVKEYCAISPGNPVTHASREAAAKEESRLDLETLHAAVTARRVIDVRKLNSADLVEDYLYAEAIPEGAVVIDIRGEGEGEGWQYPGALRQDVWDVAGHVGEMDADRTYVVYCDAGMQAVLLAEQMQRAGLEAFAFRGGTRALRKLTDSPSAV